MNIIFIGPPGSGKTTHATNTASRFALTHIDIGELIRIQASSGSKKAKLIDHLANEKGKLLPDGVVFGFLIDHLEQIGFEQIVLDGIPRNINQYYSLLDLFSTRDSAIDAAIYLKISDQVSLDRVLARNRPDDKPQAIALRLEEFHRQTKPILEAMEKDGKLYTVDAETKPEQVAKNIYSHLTQINQKLPITRRTAVSSFSPETFSLPSISNEKTSGEKCHTLFVLTHSESDFNKRHIFTGRTDVVLTKEGLRKAGLAAKILKNRQIDVAYRTSLTRTKQTLDVILKYHPDTQVVIDDRLIERDYGDLSGQNKDEFAKAHPDLYPIYHRSYDIPPPNGESMVTVEKRVLSALHEIINRMKKEKINILIVAHGNAIRPIRRYFEKLTPEEMMKLEHLRHQIFTYNITA